MLTFDRVSFSYAKKPVLNELSFTLSDGEILAVMGPSGCGKTTLLTLAAGLNKPKAGKIISTFTKIAYVFQEPRLFPWMSVEDNLRAVLPEPKQDDGRVSEVLTLVGLSDCAGQYPDELSGGMKIRASLARALIYGGDLFLLDEPFAALDEALRRSLSELLKQTIRQSGASALFVTHQLSDAQIMADRILSLPLHS
ncbi:MAG: ATP-binding cassette domain-containing protein [Clostridia bacterium]|nr:ATP-binding cassette domain-containing protein [Clostridia bacterium]